MLSESEDRRRHSAIGKSIACMATMGVDDGLASSEHGVDETVNEGHRNLGPYPAVRLSEFSCSSRPRSHVMEPPLNLVP